MFLERKNEDSHSATLCDILDKVIDKGVAVSGDVMISVADIDLICIDLKCVLFSIKAAYEDF